MNISEVIKSWKEDYRWINGIDNLFITKDFCVNNNPANIKERILYFSVSDNTYFVDGQPLPYCRDFQFQTFGQNGNEDERNGDAKRLKKELNDFMNDVIAKREIQIQSLQNEGRKVETTNVEAW
jgi:hypothetical protein